MPDHSQNSGRAVTIARPATKALSGLEAQAGVRIQRREDIRVWEQSGVERVFLEDGGSAILKYSIPTFEESDALVHAAHFNVPVPALLAHTELPEGAGVAMLLEDLGYQAREPHLADAARAAVAVHNAPGPPGRPVLDSGALAELPDATLQSLRQLNSVDRWDGPGAAALKADLERVGRVSDQRSRGAEIPPFGLAHSEFHPTSVHISTSGLHVLDLARCYTGNGLLDLASWPGTLKPLDLGEVRSLLDAYVAAGATASAEHDRGGLPAHVWAAAWHKMWVVEWYLRAELLFLEITNPDDDNEGIEATHVHLREAVSWLTS